METIESAEATIRSSRLNSLTDAPADLPGYALEESLGKGAFGTTYRAVQESTGQPVAVKVLTRVTPRFREEVKRLSAVSDHPNVVTLLDASLDHDPPFIATPLLSCTLEDQLPQNPEQVDVEQAAYWFEQLAGVLEHLHERGVLHCDLKPANILLGERNDVQLTDFGQAVLQTEEDQSPLGSFWYMPSDQAAGSAPKVSWDIYALGATAFALLNGHPPHCSETAKNRLNAQKSIEQKLEEYRVLVAEAGPLPKNPGVDVELDWIVRGCLTGGYANAREVLADLRRRREKRPVKAHPPSFLYTLRRFISRHKLSFVVATVALTVLLFGLTASVVEVLQARHDRAQVLQQRYEQGLALLQEGRATGLVWLLQVYEVEPTEKLKTTILDALARHRQVATPFLYRLKTETAPSPSGHWALSNDPKDPRKVVKVDLRDGSYEPADPSLLKGEREKKDNVRYRLDGIDLDPFKGGGGPATWRLRSIDSITPGADSSILAICIGEDSARRLVRVEGGLEVLDQSNATLLTVARPNQMPIHPTFSKLGDLAVSWEDERIEWYRSDGSKFQEDSFYGDLFCFSHTAQLLAVSNDTDRIRLYDGSDRLVTELPTDGPINEMCFSRDSRKLHVASRSGLVRSYQIPEGKEVGPPVELSKAARWIYSQEGNRLVTMSDEVTVWKEPEPLDLSLDSPTALSQEIARRTGWFYDQKSAQIRALTRSEYRARYGQPMESRAR